MINTDFYIFYRGVGDIHDRNFDKYGQGISLTGTDLFSSASAEYHLTLYPTEGFFKIYSTYNPMVASIGAVCVIIFTSLLFILYDYYVRQEFSAKRGLLEAKRQFMRFVSHEV